MRDLGRRPVLAALMLAGGAVRAAAAEPLRVLGTGAVEHPVKDLAEAFTRATGRAVQVAIGNAGGVARRLRDGEPADLVMNSASQLGAMAGVGLVDGTTIIELGRMRIGLGIRQGAPVPRIDSAEALREAILATPVIAYSDPASGATTGIHLLRMMEHMGIAATMAPRSIVFTQGLTAVEAVVQGRAGLVMTQISEIVAVPGAQLVGPLPAALNLITPYSAALPARGGDRHGGQELLHWLTGPEGQARFRAAGFLVGG